jgi:hypothetical protein
VSDFAPFAQLLDALRPWLVHLVIIGGWAHHLHRLHPLSHPPAYDALRTRDADVAFSLEAPLVGDIAATLRAAGFREDFVGEYTPPVTHYFLGTDDQGFFAEFLTPLYGSDVKRDGRRDVTVKKAGVTAQKLRYLDLLLVTPWAVRLTNELGVPVNTPLDVMLANPVSFIAQKLLIQRDRPSGKKAQDALYIHDTLELFGSELAELKALWQEQVRPRLHQKTARAIEQLHREQFGAVTDVIREAARIPQDRDVTPDRIQAVCAYGLDVVFGRK